MSTRLTVKTAKLPAAKTGLLVIYAAEDASPTGAAADIWASAKLDWARVSGAAGFTGKPGQALDILAPDGLDADRLLVLGSGKPQDNGATTGQTRWADRGGSLYAKIAAANAEKVAVVIDEPDADGAAVAALIGGLKLRHYNFDKYKTKSDGEGESEPKALTVTFHVADKPATDKALKDRLPVVEGTLLARDLVNEPPNVLGPVEFAEKAAQLTDLGVEIDILTPKEMEKLGMGALLGVAQGSVRPARMVIMRWNGGKKADKPLAFVGKGVVFDSGGLSIKPAASMENMKGDMGGAAAVTGLMHALAGRKAKVNAIGTIGLVENMPDANAYRPGDILTAMSGTTIEVINTDAEGRLVLADALWYTQDKYKPQLMINLATLTGAILVALGKDHAGLFSNNDELATHLFDAGMASGEKLWRLPMGPAYEKLIESQFADIKNSGGRLAGSITAAHFLQHFVNGVPWAHLDIAGTGFAAVNGETNRSWGPGFGVALLDQFVRDNYES